MKIAHIEWEKKPRTLGKVQKIKDLEGVGLFHPFKNTQYSDPPVLGRESDDPLAVEVVAVALGVEGRRHEPRGLTHVTCHVSRIRSCTSSLTN